MSYRERSSAETVAGDRPEQCLAARAAVADLQI